VASIGDWTAYRLLGVLSFVLGINFWLFGLARRAIATPYGGQNRNGRFADSSMNQNSSMWCSSERLSRR
jgi:hypothetical protein